MCDAPGCNGAALGRVRIGGVLCGVACSEECANRVGAAPAPIGAPMTLSELETTVRDVVARLSAVERLLGRGTTSAAAAAASSPAAAAAAEPSSASAARTIAVITDLLRPAPGLVSALQQILPDRRVVEMPKSSLVRGQHVIMAVYSSTQRCPSAADTSAKLREIIGITGVRPFLVIGSVFEMASERWAAIDYVPRNEYSDKAEFIVPLPTGTGFKRWRDQAPTASQLLSD